MAYRSAGSGTDAQIQVRVASTLRDRLQTEALRRTVSVNLLVERAIEQALEAWEKQKLP